jgi:hypothetical protein
MDDATIDRREGAPRTPAWAFPLLLPLPLAAWRALIAREIARAPDPAVDAWCPPDVRAWFGAALALGAVLAETGVYGMLWAARGRRLPLAATALVLLQLSVLEPFAAALLERQGAGPAASAWLVALLGERARWGGGPHGGFAAAFGSFGVLVLVRIALAAWAQAAGVRRPWREAAALVGVVWLASHVALAWGLDLMWGRSTMR